ncbi:MAG: TonB-dependent receptor [Massilibacteroides sp.]|nr:TonB-dependent receptor [Massilibacteroides sp.]MDD3063120.1 TonB-dependent receptor [Massilibacteroides sp.]MDD4114656.1 TonB-dependent receptor [Massilibacteroides sp.]MDD4660814.1 TonB-dependent receptor [Massilibacteroides sp.]
MKFIHVFFGFLFFWTFSISAQQQTISGTVVDEKGNPLAGVNILLKGSFTGTSSNQEGKFSLNKITSQDLLVFSFLGYLPVEKKAENKMKIILKEDAQMLNEVVVTTQKRTQSNIEVPIAVSALSGDNLLKLNIQQLDELSEYIPGMQMQLQSPNNPGYVIRGVTSDDGDSRSQPRVSVFQDGVSISRSRGSVVELYDLERIEVVKGPQGTLFGRGAEIGALHIVRQKPVNKLSAELMAGYGSHNQKLATGYINTPLIKNKLLNRFAFNYNDRDGFIKNLSGGDLNGKSVWSFRNSTRLFGGENTIADLVLDYQYDNYPGTSFKNGQYAPTGGDTDPNSMADLEQGENLYIKRHLGGTLLSINHRFNGNWELSSISGFRAFDSDESFDADGTAAPILWVSEKAKGKQFSQEFRFNYDNKDNFSGFLGASYFYENGSQEVPMRINEQSLYPTYISPVLKNMLTQQFSATGLPAEQITAISDMLFPDTPPLTNGKPNYVTNISDIRTILEQVFSAQMGMPLKLEQIFAQLPAETQKQLIGTIDLLSNHPINAYHEEGYKNTGINTATEFFADGTYKITPNLGITAGIRLSYENQKGSYEAKASEQPSIFGLLMNQSPNLLNPVSDGKITASKDYFSYVGRLVMNYMFDRNNIYASVSRGRRPGVVYVLPAKTTYLQPEIIWSYEAGIKGNILNSRLNYDLTAYYYDWNHFQTTSLTTVEGSLTPQYLSNDAGKAHSFGIETGLRYRLLPQLSIFSNYAYIDGEFADKDEDGNPQEYAGNRFRLTPKHTFSAGIDATIALKGKQTIFLRPSYSYKSKVYFEDDNTELLSQEGYGIFNYTAGIGFKMNKNLYGEISTYGKNVLNKKFIIDAGNSGNTIGMPTFIGGSPSQFGVQFKIGF